MVLRINNILKVLILGAFVVDVGCCEVIGSETLISEVIGGEVMRNGPSQT